MTDSNPSSDAGPEEALSEEEKQDLIQELQRKRSFRGVSAVVVAAVAVLFSVYQAWIAARGFVFAVPLPVVGTVELAALQQLQVNAIHVVFGLVLAFLLFPATAGDGTVSGALSQVVPELRRRFGAGHPLTRAGEGVARSVGWLVVDSDRDRVTPFDAVLIGFSVLAGWYMISEFQEIQRLRALGIDSGRTLPEIYSFLSVPVEAVSALGIPLDEVSYAYVLGVVGVLLVLEATRRSIGLALAVIVSLFLVYARYAYLIPADIGAFSVFRTSSLSWTSIVQNMWYSTGGGIFGTPVAVSVQFIYIFILFGAFLEMSGAGRWFIDLAYSLTGARKGGPAKASILSSGFMGTISGSSIANTVTTGAFTIPLMKRSGYRAEFAGAVEASASSGGQVLPPVMGAAAFLIIEYIDVAYSELIIAAAIPAVVFFFGVWVMVHLEASKVGIGGGAAEDRVPLVPHLKRGWFYLAPLVLLLYYLIVVRLSVARSAWFTIVAIAALIALIAAYSRKTGLPLLGGIAALFAAEVAAFSATGGGILAALTGGGDGGLALDAAFSAALGSLGRIILLVSIVVLLVRSTESALLDYDDQVDEAAAASASALGRPSLADNGAYRYGTFLLKSMDSGARTATPIVIAVAAAGIIPGVLGVTGLGSNLVSFMEQASGGSLPLLLVITAVGSIILGMGMPTTVTYIILASLLAPAVTEIAPEVPELAAHLFILYFGVIADITPPVAVAAYAASGVARSDPFETGIDAFALSLNKAIVPFAFVLSPGILLLRGEGANAGVMGLADLTNLGFVVPYVLIPVAAMFLGVMALGPTIIGYLYTDVGPVERALFAVASLLLMAPGLVFNPATTALGVDIASSLPYDLALRGVGAAAFLALGVKNRRAADAAEEAAATAPAS